MAHLEGIRGFLAAVRRRLLVRAGLEAVGWGAALLGVLVLSMAWSPPRSAPPGSGRRSRLHDCGVLLVALGLGLGRPALRLRTDWRRRAGPATCSPPPPG